MISDDRLKGLGLKALGDVVTLREFCNSETQALPKSDSTDSSDCSSQSLRDKRKKLLTLLGQMDSSHSAKAVTKRNPGRPICETKRCTIGLRVSKNQSGVFKQIKCPTGDKNVITMPLRTAVSYEELLKSVMEIMFPDGENQVIGPASDYHIQLVNASNKEVRTCVPGEFSLRKYIDERMVGGAPRLHLLCTLTNMQEEEDCDPDLDSNSIISESDSVDIPPLSTFINATESGEVAFRHLPNLSLSLGSAEDDMSVVSSVPVVPLFYNHLF